jgi:hypothetical protein
MPAAVNAICVAEVPKSFFAIEKDKLNPLSQARFSG